VVVTGDPTIYTVAILLKVVLISSITEGWKSILKNFTDLGQLIIISFQYIKVCLDKSAMGRLGLSGDFGLEEKHPPPWLVIGM